MHEARTATGTQASRRREERVGASPSARGGPEAVTDGDGGGGDRAVPIGAVLNHFKLVARFYVELICN